MKRLIQIITISIISISSLFAQVNETRKLQDFTEINASGIIEVELAISDEYSILVEAPQEKLSDVKTEVYGNKLSISTPGKWRDDHPKIYITLPKINTIKASGATEVYSKGLLEADKLVIKSSGASETRLSVKCRDLKVFSSGAAKLILVGYSEQLNLNTSGAAKFNGKELSTLNSVVSISGAAHATVNSSETITGNVSGAGHLKTEGDAVQSISKSGAGSISGDNKNSTSTSSNPIPPTAPEPNNSMENRNDYYREDVEITNDIVGDVIVQEHGDTTRISIGKKKILIIDGWDKTKVDLDLKDSIFEPWTYGIDGVILGVNGFLNSSNQMDVPATHEFLETDIARSHNLQITFLDADIALLKGQDRKDQYGNDLNGSLISFHTGLGLEFNSYEFRKDYTINKSNNVDNEISAYQKYNSDSSIITYKKNRLKDTYLNVPLMLAFHSSKDHIRALHLGIGGYVGLRLASKMKYKSKDEGIQKDPNDYYLSSFRYGLSASVGYSNINVFANYALNGLFEDGKGPELHPFSVGLMIVGF